MSDFIGLTSTGADSNVDEFAIFRYVLQTRILFGTIIDLPVTRVLSIAQKRCHQVGKFHNVLLSLTWSATRLKFLVSFASAEVL